MFCPCLNTPSETTPNENVCPICLAHPGVLPTINKAAIEAVLKLGLALNGEILRHSRFDRKSYFYPDLPKGYQISQYELPFVHGGELLGTALRRIHLEEDTARLLHDKEGSLVDFNRAGVPLIELVTEPTIESAEQALQFAKEFQLILRYLEIADADMEKGQMRIEANVSMAKQEAGNKKQELGIKVELKNINSFRAVKNALAYEVERQKDLLDTGEKVVQETRGWDEAKGVTVSQRGKEEAQDYRYLPEPDLPPMEFTSSEDVNLEELRRSLPELPQVKRERFLREFKIPKKQIDILISDKHLANYFENAVSESLEISSKEESEKVTTSLTNIVTSSVIGILNREKIDIQDIEDKLSPKKLAKLNNFAITGVVSSTGVVSILNEAATTGLDPDELVNERAQISDELEIKRLVEEVITENEDAVASYRKGKANALQFLAGQVMAKAKGRANPQLAQELLRKLLD